VVEKPDSQGCFSFELPMRKKTVRFKLLRYDEEDAIMKKADALQEARGDDYNMFNTLKIKESVVSIDGNTDKTYISKYIDVIPAGDVLALRRKMNEVSPDVDMKYTFTAKDGYKFDAYLSIGLDFFFPSI
jgi:hypothetical protein